MRSIDFQRGLLKFLKLFKMSINLEEAFIFDIVIYDSDFLTSYNVIPNPSEDASLVKQPRIFSSPS